MRSGFLNTPLRNLVLPLAVLVLQTGVGLSGPGVSLLSGYETDSENQSYGYVGLMAFRSPFVLRLWADEVRYSFRIGPERIRARAPGISVGTGLGFSGGSGFLNILGGWEVRDVRVSPRREEVRVKGRLEGFFASLDAGLITDRNRLYFTASYSFATTYLWGRLRVLRNLREGLSVGGELVAHGNEDYKAFQTGVVTEVGIGFLLLTFKLGYKRDSVGDKAYGGLETYLEF
jgi:hypothetical protein